MPRDAVSRTANVGTVGKNGLKSLPLPTLKSMYPFLSMSKVRNTWSQNSSALPDGKNILYMSTNLSGVRQPLGQSCCGAKNQGLYNTVYQIIIFKFLKLRSVIFKEIIFGVYN